VKKKGNYSSIIFVSLGKLGTGVAREFIKVLIIQNRITLLLQNKKIKA